jgi:uncharacterized protein involved in exopolysaccharide biosynthesis/Mrp family chromosome partitioning ATPase
MSSTPDAILDDMKDLGRALRDHVTAIIVVTVLVCTAAFVLLVTTPDKYRAVAMLMLDTRDHHQEAVPLPELEMTDEEKILLTEIEIIRSREIVDEVISRFALDKRPEFNPDLPAPSRMDRLALWMGDRFGVAPLNALTGAPAPAAFDDAPGAAGRIMPVDGKTVYGTPDNPGLFPAAVYQKVYAALTTRIRGGSRIVEIAFQSSDPRLASDVANALAQSYLEQRKQSTVTDASNTMTWLDGRVDGLQGEVNALETSFAKQQEESGILEQGRASILTQRIEQLNERLTTLRGDEAQLKAQYQRIRQGLAADEFTTLVELVDTPQMSALKAALTGKMADASRLRSRLGDRHPDIIAAEAEITTLQDRIKGEARAFVAQVSEDAAAKGQEADAVEGRLSAMRNEIGGMGQQRADLQGLERQIDAKRDLLNSFLERRAQLAMVQDESIVRSPLTLVSQAQEPQLPSSPRRPLLMAVAAAIGLMLGMISALLLDLMSNRLRRRGQLKKIVAEVRILGYLPPIKSSWAKGLALGGAKKSAAIYDEAARRLQGSMLLELKMHGSTPGKVVMFTSSQPGEGKTTTAQALAEKAARSGQQVLLMGCDPKRPKGRYEPTIGGQNGVMDVLKGRCRVDMAKTIVAGFENLDFLPSGQLNESNQDLLGGPGMDTLLDTLKADYDLIIIDAPPVNSLSYVLPLGIKSDLVAYVARWKRAGVKEVIEGVRQFRDYDTSVGLVMTNMHRGAAIKFGLRPIQSYYQSYVGPAAEI